MVHTRWQQQQTVTLNKERTALVIIDQTKLPNEEVFLELKTQEEIFYAIQKLQVRGAPAIGVAAAGGICLAAQEIVAADFVGFYQAFLQRKAYLAASRPTAVNLFWALDRMEQAVLQNKEQPIPIIKQKLIEEAERIKEEDIAVCRSIGLHGLELIRNCQGILTHCNAGRLATVQYGTALAPLYIGKEQGLDFHVYADETRPLLQGARLTAYELTAAGIETTVICDNMASAMMKQGKVQAVLVGADRIAANGDVANKIGTSGVAVLAKYYGIPFYVLAPKSTIDLQCPGGNDIVIEQRAAAEVRELWYQQPMVPPAAGIENPAFDVTDNRLVTAIVTEAGAIRPPYTEQIARIFR